jgi:hypothetical protein
MPQPLSHAIIQWQVRRQLLELECDKLRAALAAMPATPERVALAAQLRDAERRVDAMGPMPSAKMG